jgi:Tol biopolymer transport system component
MMTTKPQFPILPALPLLTIIAGLLFSIQPAGAQEGPEPRPVSVSPAGNLGNGTASHPSLAAGGRFVTFASQSSNLVADDTNGVSDVFVHDRLTGETERVSLSSTGEQANAACKMPSISDNGRFVAFHTAAENLAPDGQENVSHIYVHDRLTGITERVSINDRGEPGDGDSSQASLSADGRYVAFRSQASNLVKGDDNGFADVFIHDRLTGHTRRASVSSRGNEGNAPSGALLALAPAGHTVAFTSEASTLAVAIAPVTRVYLYNRVVAKIEYLNILPSWGDQANLADVAISEEATIVAVLATDGAKSEILIFDRPNQNQITLSLPDAVALALSPDGEYLAVLLRGENGASEVIRYNLETEEQQTLISGDLGEQVVISGDGNVIAYTQELEDETQIAAQEVAEAGPRYTLSGRVTDGTGYPLAHVTINYGDVHSTKTDGNGFYFINGILPGDVELVPSKQGYNFEPESRSLDVQSDQNDLDFQSNPEEILAEGRKDLGMPYREERGESGPYHGYAGGYCTDLVLDAYSWGADYDIQFALEQDFRAHPEHFYRWRDARDAHDMWRYFSYSGQMLPHAVDYQPGDMTFFDWSGDGEIDHVALISEVDADNRPVMMYAATGVTNRNPGGRAAELPWENFHEETVRGHARWSGAHAAIIPEMPSESLVQVAVSSAAPIELRLLDSNGNVLSNGEKGIPGGFFNALGWEQNLSLLFPLEHDERYTIQITVGAEEDDRYQFTAQTIEAGVVTARTSFEGDESKTLPLLLFRDEAGKLNMELHLSQRRIRRSLSD